RMPDLASLAVYLDFEAGTGALLGSRAECQRRVAHLEDFSLHLREEVHGLIHQRGHRGRSGGTSLAVRTARSLRRRLGLGGSATGYHDRQEQRGKDLSKTCH